MVPDGVDVEHEILKCGMCIVNERDVLQRENEYLRKEVGGNRLEETKWRKQGRRIMILI